MGDNYFDLGEENEALKDKLTSKRKFTTVYGVSAYLTHRHTPSTYISLERSWIVDQLCL